MPTHKNTRNEPETNILKTILLKGLEVKTLQQICINYINREGPSLLNTVLKLSDDEDSEIDDDDDDDKITESSENSMQQNGCPKKTRRMERVRYWNDDDFLFFENFLLQEQQSKRKVATKLNKKLMNKETDVDITEIKQHLQNNTFLQLNSAVSIQLLKANCHFKIKCEICGICTEDLAKLAIHKLEHLKVSTNRIDEVKILNGSLRRGRIILVQSQKRVRCSNCLKTFSTAPLIKQHWAEGKCDFFCKICGLHFHSNPFLLRVHYSSVHGIRFTVQGLTERKPAPPALGKIFIRNIDQINSNGFVNPSTSATTNPVVIRRKKKSKYAYLYSEDLNPGRVTCNICLTSFPNMKSRNSHMRLHKLKVDKPPPPVDEMNYSREYTCGPCGVKCKNKSILYLHKKNCPASNQFSCPFCLKHFPSSADLQVHVMNLHPD